VIPLDCSEASSRLWTALDAADCRPRGSPRKGMALCPAHADGSPSLSVGTGDDGRVLVRCFAGCRTEDILAALGLSWADLFSAPEGPRPTKPFARRRPSDCPTRGFPPREEVLAVWNSAIPVTTEDVAAVWLRSRGLDPEVVHAEDAARVIPHGAHLPRWAFGCGSTWSRGLFRLLLSMYDADGNLVTLRARRITEARDNSPKELSPTGFTSKGTVLADLVGRQMLGGSPPCGGILIVEGVPDWLTWATRRSDADEAPPAVLGVTAGAWTSTIAARIPDASRVVLRMHRDEAGEGYRRAVIETLASRVDLLEGEAP
jgi:hypothetical protein